MPFPVKNAAAVALQGKAVDLIVTDWFWVSRQRSEDRNFTFVPHSMAAGGLIVSKDSKIAAEMDLKDKKIGVAGGQVDKGWLIFRAYYLKKYGKDLIKLAKPIFGAPPLLNKKIEQIGVEKRMHNVRNIIKNVIQKRNKNQ